MAYVPGSFIPQMSGHFWHGHLSSSPWFLTYSSYLQLVAVGQPLSLLYGFKSPDSSSPHRHGGISFTRGLLRPHPVFIATSQGTVQTVQAGAVLPSHSIHPSIHPFTISASPALWSLSQLSRGEGGLVASISWQFTAGSTQRGKQGITLTPLDNPVSLSLMCKSLNCWKKQGVTIKPATFLLWGNDANRCNAIIHKDGLKRHIRLVACQGSLKSK